jgi:hypothetical protein
MTALPEIDSDIIIPSFEETQKLIENLSLETSKFNLEYRNSLTRLTPQGLKDSLIWFGQIQETGSGMLHIIEFLETKFPEESPPFAVPMRAVVLESMSRTIFFIEFLLKMPRDRLETLSRNPDLFKLAPYLRFMMRQNLRQEKPLPPKYLEDLGAKLKNHFVGNPNLDKDALRQLIPFSRAFLKASQHGFSDPLAFDNYNNLLGENEVAALRGVLDSHKDILRQYLGLRGLKPFSGDSSSLRNVDTPGVLDWKKAADLTVKAHAALSPELGDAAESIFSRGLARASSRRSSEPASFSKASS